MSVLLVISPYASLLVTVFNSYPELIIFNFLTASTSSSDLSRFSLVKIAFGFSLYELDACLNVSSVTSLASVIDPTSSSLMTFKIFY